LAFRQVIFDLLKKVPIFVETSNHQLSNHIYETLAKQIIEDKEYGKRFSIFITDSVIAAANVKAYPNDRIHQIIVRMALSNYPKITLLKFADHIENPTTKNLWYFSGILGDSLGFDETKVSPISELSDKFVLSMCASHPKKFAVLVAQIATLFKVDNIQRSWTTLARSIFKSFGNRTDILSALSSNIGTGGWSGTHSEYLKTFLAPLNELLEHDRPEVRRWARLLLKQYNRNIEIERMNEEQDSLRFG
jgi:hypothetical protein